VRRTKTLFALLAVLCLGAVFAACGSSSNEKSSSGSSSSSSSSGSSNRIKPVSGASSKPTITVGSKNFTEQFVLGEIYSQALQAAGYKVKKELNLGSELIAYKALKAGKIDAYPEYTGTALTSFFGVKTNDVPKDAEKAYQQTKEGFAKNGITALPHTPFQNTFRLTMTKAKAQKLGVKTTSDLKGKEHNLAISGFPECKQREDCLLGVEKAYGLKFGKFVASEQKYQVLDSGDADVVFGFTTDGDLAGGKYVTLDDDKKFFPPYNVTFAIRNEALKNIGPEGQKVIEQVQKPLTEKVMQELNARVDIDKQKPEQAAKSYLQQAGFTK
jgi:glycine betaine/choline ABC-type transport system substrate-binding protein